MIWSGLVSVEQTLTRLLFSFCFRGEGAESPLNIRRRKTGRESLKHTNRHTHTHSDAHADWEAWNK